MAERLGLWLAKWALRLTGNRALGNACSVLPLIRERRFLISVHPADRELFQRLSAGTWAYWTSEESPLPQLKEPA